MNSRAATTALILLMLLMLGTPILPVDTALAHHCKGKHKNDPGCDGGGDPPPPSVGNPGIVAVDQGHKERMVVMDGDGGNLTELAKDDFRPGARIQWSPDGSFVVWPGNISCAVGGWLMVPFDSTSGAGVLKQIWLAWISTIGQRRVIISRSYRHCTQVKIRCR